MTTIAPDYGADFHADGSITERDTGAQILEPLAPVVGAWAIFDNGGGKFVTGKVEHIRPCDDGSLDLTVHENGTLTRWLVNTGRVQTFYANPKEIPA